MCTAGRWDPLCTAGEHPDGSQARSEIGPRIAEVVSTAATCKNEDQPKYAGVEIEVRRYENGDEGDSADLRTYPTKSDRLVASSNTLKQKIAQ